MANLKFADTHNMVAFLSKPEESDGFEQIVDFLNAHPIKYALTVNPTIYISCIEQFWSTVKAKTINGEVQLHALVDGKKIIITESTVRRDLQLEDAEGVDCLPNSTIFEQLTLMGSKTTAWNEFSSTMASVIICLAINQKFNFLKYIFESMIRNLDNLSSKFLMYPRNMRRVGKGFSGRVTPLFQTMMVQNQSELGEGSANLTDLHHTPTIIHSSTQPQKTQKPRKLKREHTQIPQSNDPSDNVADEAVHKELGDSLVRAATTASSLEAEQDSGNITKTRSKETPNESSSLGTTSGGSPRGNTLRSDDDRLKLDEVMALCTTLQNRILDLEKTKTTQANEIAKESKNSGNVGRNNRRAYVQGEVVEGMNATNETANVQRIVRTPTPGNTSSGSMKKLCGDEADGILTDEHNDFLFADASMIEEIEELSANICLMAKIQPADQNSDDKPSYESADYTHVYDQCALETLARNAYAEAAKQQRFAQKVQQQNMTLTSQIEMYKERNRVLENITKDNNYLKEFLEADERAKRVQKQADSQLYRDREIIRDLEKQRDELSQEIFDGFQNLFQRDIKEMKDAFEQNDVYLDEIERQNDLLKDQLLEASLKHDIELCVLLNHECVDESLHDELEQVKKKSLEIQEEKQKWDSLKNKNSKPLDFSWISRIQKLEDENVSLDFKKYSRFVLWFCLDMFGSKHMMGDRALLRNFVEKFMGTVRFGNDNFAAITSYGDYIHGHITICHVYYVEGLRHNLFSVGQFCDGDLEVAFRSKICYVRNLEGDDLLTGGRNSNLYTISISDMDASSPICLMSKATSTKSWLWHRRLSHLNFGTINDLTKLDLVDGLPKFKYGKDHLFLLVKEEKARKLLIHLN
ncbi:integrase, catalytic region, zinc finger, CCHC-type containing protein [Tanacetum coccineum]